MQAPLTNPDASSDIRKSSAPTSSSGWPKRPMGVAARIFPVRAVGDPSGLKSSAAFCRVEKNPGAIALQRIPS